jgi:hypothetical protein
MSRDLKDLYERRTGFEGNPLADDELLFLLENAMETTKSLEARGLYFGLAISAMRSEVEMLAHMATARGLNP